jgi:thiamine pyrophosphokinase
MPSAVIVLKLAKSIPAGNQDYIGVDKGTLLLMAKGLPCRLAIGDFDSVTEEELIKIKAYAQEVVQLNPVKDDTDSEAALREAKKRGYTKIIFAGALGGRSDHALINLRLAEQNPGLVILQDAQNRIEAFCKGSYEIKKENNAYFSFFTEDTAEISLEGFKYPLQHRMITNKDLYTVSNELLVDKGTLTVHQGIVLMIAANDER